MRLTDGGTYPGQGVEMISPALTDGAAAASSPSRADGVIGIAGLSDNNDSIDVDDDANYGNTADDNTSRNDGNDDDGDDDDHVYECAGAVGVLKHSIGDWVVPDVEYTDTDGAQEHVAPGKEIHDDGDDHLYECSGAVRSEERSVGDWLLRDLEYTDTDGSQSSAHPPPSLNSTNMLLPHSHSDFIVITSLLSSPLFALQKSCHRTHSFTSLLPMMCSVELALKPAVITRIRATAARHRTT